MAAYPPMSDQLREMGIAIMEPYAAKNLEPRPDLVVVGNAISRGNVELERVLDERIPMTSMAALIHDEFLAERERLVVDKGISNFVFHYLGSAKILGGIGKGFAETMAELKQLKPGK